MANVPLKSRAKTMLDPVSTPISLLLGGAIAQVSAPDGSWIEKGGIAVFASVLLYFVLFRLEKVIDRMDRKLGRIVNALGKKGIEVPDDDQEG